MIPRLSKVYTRQIEMKRNRVRGKWQNLKFIFHPPFLCVFYIGKEMWMALDLVRNDTTINW